MKRERVEILFQDEVLLIVSKPAGMLSIPDRFVPEKENLLDWLRDRFGQVFVVHRLDRETSGVICFARTEDAHRHLSLQFENRQVNKYYLALAEGSMPEESYMVDKPIAPHPTQSGKMILSKKGKESLTLVRPLERFRAFTLVEAEIRTGRTHQVRVHLQALGHPLVADPLYGRREALLLSEVKIHGYHLGRDQEERPLLQRTALHAWKLVLEHPVSGQKMSFEAPLPRDLQAVLQQLRKWGR